LPLQLGGTLAGQQEQAAPGLCVNTQPPNYTLNAQRAFGLALKEAERIGNDYLGAEHLFLGVLSVSDCGAVKVLKKLALEIENVRKEVEKRAGPGRVQSWAKDFPITPRVRRILKLASEQAKELDADMVGTEHILLGFLREADSLPVRVLLDSGVSVERVQQAIAVE
jgi:ATP-dependent Clp protease ATP-binding subunit ClpC